MKIQTKLFLIIMITCWAKISYAQNIFEKILKDTFNVNSSVYGRASDKTFDGGYILTGYSFKGILLIKTNQNGDTLWTKTFSSGNPDSSGYGNCVRQTSDSGYIITGVWSTRDIIDTLQRWNNLILIKTDSTGNVTWSKIYSGTVSSWNSYRDAQGNSVQQTNDGGYIVAGTKTSAAVFDDIYLIRTNSSGDTLWTRTIGGSMYEVASSVIQTYDNGFAITGHSNSFLPGTTDRGYTVKVDSAGNLLWSKIYSGTTNSGMGRTELLNILQTGDSNLIITGFLYDSLGNGGLCLIRTNSVGDTMWIKTYGGETGYSVQQTADSGFIVSGTTRNSASFKHDIYLLKTNLSGDTAWTKIFSDTAYNNFGFSVSQASDGGYFIGGTKITFGSGQKREVYFIKTDSIGNTNCINSGIGTFGNSPTIVITTPSSVVTIDTTYVQNISLIENVTGLKKDTLQCSPQGIHSILETSELNIYPNPFNETINIISNKYVQNGSINVYSTLGVKLFSKTFKGHFAEINLKLVKGIYVMQLINDEKIWTRKIIKQ